MAGGSVVAAVVITACVAAGCRSSPAAPGHYGNARDLMKAVSGVLQCELPPPLPAGGPTFGPDQGIDLVCFDRRGTGVSAQWFPNHADLLKTVRCCYTHVKGFIVSGDNWIVATPVAADRRELAARTGGHEGEVR
jgi:hypothetical protein